MEKKGQQEIAGFILIVVLVVVAIFIFVIMYFANREEDFSSKEVDILLTSMLKTTTDCFLEGVRPANLEEVIRDSFSSLPRNCKNSGKSSRTYLEGFIPSFFEKIFSLETNFESYVFEIVDKKSGEILMSFNKGNCVGKETKGSDFLLSNELQIFLRVC